MSSLLDTWNLIRLREGPLSSPTGRQLLGGSGKRSRHTGESATVPAVSREDKIIISSPTTLAELA